MSDIMIGKHSALRVYLTALSAIFLLPGLGAAQSVRPHRQRPVLVPPAVPSIAHVATNTVTPMGVWVPLANQAPEYLAFMMLLSDGTVMANGYNDNTWYRLTPDIKGSYVNGTWSQLASMKYKRLDFQSDVLPSGKIFVSGGEYGNAPVGSAELYDPVANEWTELANATTVHSDVSLIDGISTVLPNGNVLVYSVGGLDCIDSLAGIHEGATLIYDVPTNSWSAAPCSIGNQDETTWVKLPDNSILSLDLYSTTSERYLPSTNQWIADAPPPLNLFNANGELGGGFLLPNGKVFYIGGTSSTLIYTPSGSATPGSWVIGPSIPTEGGLAIGGNDAPAAMMANGMVLMAEDPYACGYCGPTYFFVYNYISNSLTPINAPGGTTSLATNSFVMDMLDLPDGSVLLSPFSPQLYTFQPTAGQLTGAKNVPVINKVIENADGSYLVTGFGLNGISQGASYGDEYQNSTNYPIARLTNPSNGDVYYARTYDWTSTGVATGNTLVSTRMTLPAALPSATYQLSISANGISSTPVALQFPFVGAPTLPSILWQNNNGDVVLWQISGGTIASSANFGVIPAGWSIQGTGDFNGDGTSDILWQNKTTGDVVLWFVSGGTITSSADLGTVPSSWTIQGTGDFNGDGATDILWRNSSGDVVIWFMNGGTITSSADLGVLPGSWTIQGTGDFNSDGLPDILWRNSNGDVVIWFMNGGTIGSVADLGVVSSSWTIQGTASNDVLWRNANGDVVIWFMDGGVIASSTDLGVVPGSWTVQGMRDFNGDGEPDILWRNSNGDVVIWFMNGGTIASSADLGVVPSSWSIQP